METRIELSLPPNTDVLLRELIHDYCGQHYDDTRLPELLRKLTPLALARGCKSFIDYFYLLKYDAQADDEWPRVLDALAVAETYFWREHDQIRTVCEFVLPELARLERREPIRLWSAACASGEEPLSLAMALQEAGWFARVPIEIHPSDASGAALVRAQAGLYRERAFRALPPALRSKYFTAHDGGYRVAPELHARIRWRQANLLNADAVSMLARAQVIFCRNVFIYFSEAAVRATVRRFAQSMPTPGFLFVAAAESLLNVTHDFALEGIGGALVYVKRGAAGRATHATVKAGDSA